MRKSDWSSSWKRLSRSFKRHHEKGFAIVVGHRVIVCGGRSYRNQSRLWRVLDAYHARFGIEFLIQGSADGADYLAWQWAEDRNVPVGSYPARWDEHGKAAGPIRNREMLTEGKPDVVLAFPGGPGSRNMVAQAENAGVKVYKIDWT